MTRSIRRTTRPTRPSTRRRQLTLLGWLLSVLVLVLAAPALASPLRVEVLEDNSQRIVVRYELYTWQSQTRALGNESYTSVFLGRESRLKEKGAPELPTVNRSLALGSSATVQATVVDSSYHDINDVNVLPSKGILYRSVHSPAQVPHSFGPTYQNNAFFPGKLVDVDAPYWLRDYRGVRATVYPFQYNPVTRTLRIYDSLTVSYKKQSHAQGVPGYQPTGFSRSFATLAKRHFINGQSQAAYAPLNEEGEMLIIAYDAFLPNIQPFVAHKNAIGIPTTAVGINSIGNSVSAIKSYIQAEYQTRNLSFVLLVGDAQQIKTPFASGGAADATYAKVAGNDSYPDVLIGRFSASQAAHVDTQVKRSIDYELNQAAQQAWFKKAVGIGSYEGPGDDGEMDYQHIDNIRKDLLGYGYSEVDQFYGPQASTNQLVNALNQGRGMVNYAGHGDPYTFVTTKFSTGDVSALNNTGKLPFIQSVACNTGEHNTGTCLAEKLLRATKNGQPTGAVGMYASSILQSWNPPMAAQDESVDLLVSESYLTLGGLMFAGSCRMIDEYGSGGVEMFNTWHLFGDPSLRISGTVEPAGGMHVTPDQGLEAEGPVGGPFPNWLMNYELSNNSDYPIDISANHSAPWFDVVPQKATVPAGASITVTVSLNPSSHTLPLGLWTDSVLFVNETDHEGDTHRDVKITVGQPERVHWFPMDEDPGWTREGLWQFGTPTGQGGGKEGGPDPTSGHSGPNVFGFNLQGNYPANMPAKHLTTHAIDCRGLARTELRFYRWLNVEEAIYDHASIAVSTDGQVFHKVWENGPTLTDSAWSEVVIDLSKHADNQETVFVRWTMGSTDEGLHMSGWNIDDVSIWGIRSSCDDADGDGVLPPVCGGNDCHDGDPTIYPGAGENCNDGVDNDCDGAVDAADVDCGGDDGNNGPPNGGNDNNTNSKDEASRIPLGLKGMVCGCRTVGRSPQGGNRAAWWLLAAAILLRRKRTTRLATSRQR